MASCQNTSKTPAIDLANFDLSVAPNADFYEYATGGWQKNNPLKPEYSRYGSFDILRDNNEKRINELFSEMTKMKAEPGSIEQKISDLYKMGLDSVRLNAEGVAPVKDAVGEILAIGDSENDLEMLNAVALPIAMGNASAAVKNLCLRETLTNAQDGVAAAIDRIIAENG